MEHLAATPEDDEAFSFVDFEAYKREQAEARARIKEQSQKAKLAAKKGKKKK